jgi:hypothetical protein
MSNYAMSSNCFLNVPELPVYLLSVNISHPPWLRRAALGFKPQGGWYLRLPGEVRPVLLLRNRSFWHIDFSMLTVRLQDNTKLVVAAFRPRTRLAGWRRMRVWYHCCRPSQSSRITSLVRSS